MPSRDDVRELMSRPEFQYPKSIAERIGDWIGERLDRLFDRVGMPDTGLGGGSLGGGVGSIVAWLLIVLAAAAVIAVIVITVRQWRPRAREEELLSEAEVEHRRRAGQWARDAERHEAAGQWKLAIRARLRELVRTLVDRRQVADLAGRTTGELVDDIALTTPAATAAFEEACLLFELPWYGEWPTGAEENARFRELAAAVLAAPVEHHMDGRPVAEPGREVLVGVGSPDRGGGPGGAVHGGGAGRHGAVR